MSDIENPSAFPRTGAGFGNPEYDAPGMTLRDWFAGQCDVSAYSAFASYRSARGSDPTVADLAAYIAQIRYVEADAMLAARTQEVKA